MNNTNYLIGTGCREYFVSSKIQFCLQDQEKEQGGRAQEHGKKNFFFDMEI